MSNLQLKKEFTMMPNEILEALATTSLNGTQRRILDVVIRQTYGYHREAHSLSISFIAKATGLHENSIQREMKNLIDRSILMVVSESTYCKSRKIGINKDYKGWQNKGDPIYQVGPNRLDVSPTNELVGLPPNGLGGEIKKVKKVKESPPDYRSVYDYYLSLDLIQHRDYTPAMIKAIKKAIKENHYTIEDCKKLLDRHKQVVKITKGEEYPIKMRGILEFFGQKVVKGTHLICSEYEEGGKLYEKHIKRLQETKKVGKTVMMDDYLRS